MATKHPFAEYIEYEFKEEEAGFGVPYLVPDSQRTHKDGSAPGGDPIERVGAGLVVIGVVALLVQLVSGAMVGSWVGFSLSFGFPALGASLYFWAKYRHTAPGIKNDGLFFKGSTARGTIGWMVGVGLTTFYCLLYWYPEVLRDSGLVAITDPIAIALTGRPGDHWFVYGLLYTLCVGVFGIRMLMRYRHNRYHIVRTISVMFFQMAFGFLIPSLLKLIEEPEFNFTTFWPLNRYYLLPGENGMAKTATEAAGQVGVYMLLFAGAMTFLGTPILTYFYGKRWYCSWVCGCGGLAETLGDPYRHLSDKSTKAWKLERFLIYFVLAFIILVTAALWINHTRGGDVLGGYTYQVQKAYGFWIGSMFAGVAGVGFYPIFGSRVWCRFGCPQAAILGILQRVFSRFRITTNGGQCISCGNCSTYCEMGIDVRAYAQRGENIVRASCVGCGVCAAVCPRGVLKLENGSSVLLEERYTS